MCGYHMNDWLTEAELPLRYCGVSTCFRKEAGSSGKDIKGIFRVHQFEKIEQFVVCKDDLAESMEMQRQMIQSAEEFYQVRDSSLWRAAGRRAITKVARRGEMVLERCGPTASSTCQHGCRHAAQRASPSPPHRQSCPIPVTDIVRHPLPHFPRPPHFPRATPPAPPPN